MTAESRRRVVAAGAALAVIGGVTVFNLTVVRSGPTASAILIFSACFAISVVAMIGAEWSRSRSRVVPWTAAAALVSTAATLMLAPRDAPQDAFWIVAEVLALLTLLVLVVRWAPVGRAVGGAALASAAVILTLRRVTVVSSSDGVLEWVGAVLNWSFGAAAAVGLGLYLRTLDAKRARMVVESRRAQRLELARDLHDFVAHDVTGMVVQAQAAHLVAGHDPEEVITALQRIEEAGLRALGSLDHTVSTLGELTAAQGRAVAPATDQADIGLERRRFGLDDILALVGRFAATDARPIRLSVEAGADMRLRDEVTTIAYRVMLEALTNVRRHAASGARVSVRLAHGECASGAALTVRVTNEAADGVSALSTPRGATEESQRGGRGLGLLADCVEEVGGTFAAGECDEQGTRGWQLTAVLPLRRVRPS